jgi:hypothetical protein
MVGVAQSVRALDCGSRGCGFNSRHSPHLLSGFRGFPGAASVSFTTELTTNVLRGQVYTQRQKFRNILDSEREGSGGRLGGVNLL